MSQLPTHRIEPGRPALANQRLEQARRRRAKGDHRRALVLFREACCLSGDDPVLWTLLGVQCWRANRRDEARQSIRQALWLRERLGDAKRAHVLRALLLAVESACAPTAVRAA